MEKKRLNIPYSYLTKIRLIVIIGFLFDEYLLLQVSKNDVSEYIAHKFKYFTSWSHMITFLYFILVLTIQKDNKKRKNNLSILFQLAFSCQFMVTVVYWSMLHDGAMKKIKCPYLIKYCYTSHILPFIYLLIDFFFNNIILQSKKTFYIVVGFTTTYLFWLGYLELVHQMELYEGITFRSNLIRYVYFLFWNRMLYNGFFRMDF